MHLYFYSMSASNDHPAVCRLPSSVLNQIADDLTGLDAVNFGRVCKAWVGPAERAIWKDIKITLPRRGRETQDAQSTRSIRVASWLAGQIQNGPYSHALDRVRTEAARWARLREKYEGLLAALSVRPERIRMVRSVTMCYGAGAFGITLLSLVRQHITSLRILHPDRLYEATDPQYLGAPPGPGTSIWPLMSGLLSSSATFDALQDLHLQVDETITDFELQPLLLLTHNLQYLAVDIEDDPYVCLWRDYRDHLETVRKLHIKCTLDTGSRTIPMMATNLLEACSNVTDLTFLHEDDMTGWSDVLTEDFWDIRDRRFVKALGSLKNLESFMGQESVMACFPTMESPVFTAAPPKLDGMIACLNPGEWKSLRSRNLGEFVPRLPKLQMLIFHASRICSTGLKARLKPSNRFGLIRDEDIDCFDSAPLLEAIIVMLIPRWHATTSAPPMEMLRLATLRKAGTTGPHLYLINRAISHGRNSETDSQDQMNLNGGGRSRFEGRLVPVEVIYEMEDIEGVRQFRGRDVAVSSRAWEVLEAYMGSAKAAEDT